MPLSLICVAVNVKSSCSEASTGVIASAKPASTPRLVWNVSSAREARASAGSGAAGNLDGPAAVATFDGPQAIAIASDHSIYVTVIRRSLIRGVQDGVGETIAGDGTRGWIDSEDPRLARFYGLEGIAVDDGRIIVGDGNRGDDMPFHRVRVIDRAAVP